MANDPKRGLWVVAALAVWIIGWQLNNKVEGAVGAASAAQNAADDATNKADEASSAAEDADDKAEQALMEAEDARSAAHQAETTALIFAR